jgi:hypothetical protein|tara:strand:+ start:234 stop:485 length:252 start_codon:yes stop_codon:yes gene_type:complete
MPTEKEHVKKVMDESKVDTVILGTSDGSVKVYKDGELVRSGGLEVGAAFSGEVHVFCVMDEEDKWECDKFEDGIEGEAKPLNG